MAILHVRFGSMLNTVTPAASALICAAAEDAFERRTPEGGVTITNSHYEGDWDAEIASEGAETVAHWVVRVWMDSSIEEDEVEEVYTLRMYDDAEGSESITLDCADEADAKSQIDDACEQWATEGEWGQDGALIDVRWYLDLNGEEIDRGHCSVQIDPDHAALIRAACGSAGCGTNPDDHDWTAEGEGGCDENPGVWSHGGTSMSFSTHCRTCGLRRMECTTGSQRNPGDHDTTSYDMPASWCAECQREECTCEE